MKKSIASWVVAVLLTGCAAFGPPGIHLSRADIAQRAFIDRDALKLPRVFSSLDGVTVSGPDVGLQTQAQRLELEWSFRLNDAAGGLPIALSVSVSGRPELNATRTGIDLADARIEQVRLPALPLLNIGAGTAPAGESLGRLPLLAFRSDELNRDGVLYQATGLAVGTFGVRVALTPK